MKALGHHLIVELYDCDHDRINDVESVKQGMLRSAQAAGAEVIQPVFHKFSPHGVSGVVVIAESHFAIHTWPEYGYCALDIFTCGDSIDNELALQILKEDLGATSLSVMETKRGVLNMPVEKLRHKPLATSII